MPIGTEQWRAGVGCYRNKCSLPSAFLRVPLCDLLATALQCFAYLYLIIAVSLITLPASVLTTSLFAHFPGPSLFPWSWQKNLVNLKDQRLNFALSTSYVITTIYFLFFPSRYFINMDGFICMTCPKIRKQYRIFLHNVVYALLISNYLDIFSVGENFPTKLIMLLAGDIETQPGPSVTSCLKFCHWNLNSICARGGIKTSLIEAYNSIHHFDVIAISESMLDRTISNDDIFIEGFSRDIYRSDHPSNSKIGGVCLYFRESLPVKRRSDLEELQELIVTEVIISRKKVFFVTLYRSPSQDSVQFEDFIDKLQSLMEILQAENPHSLILTGDFNCRSSQWWVGDTQQPEGTALEELIETNNLHQLIEEPTNIREGSMSCIDLIITDQPNLFADYGVHPSLDEHCQHQIVYGKINISIPCPPPYKRTIWDYAKANIQNIHHDLQAIDWHTQFDTLGPEEMAENFTSSVYTALSSYIPNKVVKCCDKDPPWINPGLKSAIKRKQKVYRNFCRRGRRPQDWTYVKSVRNETSKMILNAKEEYFKRLGRKLSDPSEGIKSYWSTLNRLINKKKTLNIPPLLENGQFITNIQSKATILNDFFVEQCSAEQTGSTLPNIRPRCDTVLENVEIDRAKVLNLIRSLDASKAHGSDNISISMIKICDSSIVEPLCVIFEKCLSTGQYPSIWKKANIIPVHKKGSRQCKNNYRPISLLPVFGKLFEKLLFDSMYYHFCDNGLLTDHQSGFRPGDSTINQLLSISHKIYTGFDETPSRETRAVFLDFSKAFDKVWHEGLLYKLECNGISGNLLKLIRNFLSNRKQRVLLNGKNSEWADISAGVPQGSVLGPLFFLIYINDLVDGVRCDVKLFADDTSLFSAVYDVSKTAQDLERDLERVRIWAWQWKMKFNTEKTEEVIFSAKRVKPEHPPLSFGNDDVVRKSEHKHLGMILDSKLDFESHITEAIQKARRGIGMIRYLSKYVSRDILDQIYKLYVRPYLDYGDIIYHKYDPPMRLNFTQRLERIQYCAALAVTGAWRGTSRERLYRELGWESLYHRRCYRRLCHFYNLIKSHSPEYLFAQIPPERNVSQNLRRIRSYDQNIGRTARFANTYFQNAPFEWNLLDDDTRNSKTISEFKRKLLATIRPNKKPIYGINDIIGIRLLSKLRLEFSGLNEHKFRHNFDCLDPICLCRQGNEDTEHFLLHCPIFEEARRDLLGSLSDIPGLDITRLDAQSLCILILYGKANLTLIANRMIIEATITYIKATKRLD